MKISGFFKWLNSRSKMKRWIFLSLIAITLICFGISSIIVKKTLETVDIVKIAFSFIIGFTLMVIAIVHLQRRTLEMLVEQSDTRKKKNNVNTLIFNKRVYNQGPKIVVIGGGTGLNTVLRGLKHYTDNITAIVTVSDYGQTPTNSRQALKLLPLNDIKESIAALAQNEESLDKLLDCKFNDGVLNTLSFADIYFLAMNKVQGNFSKSIEESSKVLNIIGKVLPVTLEEITICAELEDGTVIESKDKIPEIVGQSSQKISRIYITPTNCKSAPGVIEAIKDADAIIIGPGSLYTNVIPNLLVNGVARAIKNSKAMKVYVSNIMTEYGQTDEYTLSEHIKAVQDYLGPNTLDYCIYDTGEIIPEYIHKYNRQGRDIVLPDTTESKALGVKLVQRNLSAIEKHQIVHDSDAIASTIIQLICDELSFIDKENDSQFLMLNSKLTETKRQMKKREKAEKKFNESGKKVYERNPDQKSKFSGKYKERVSSIKDSDKTRKRNKETVEIIEKSKVEKPKEVAKYKSKHMK